MNHDTQHVHLADEVVKRFAGTMKGLVLYGKDHPIVERALESLVELLDRVHVQRDALVIGILDGQVIVNDVPVPRTLGASEAIERLRTADVERIAVERGVTRDEIVGFLNSLATAQARRTAGQEHVAIDTGPHIRVGRLQVQKRVDGDAGRSLESAKDAWAGAVGQAEQLCTSRRQTAPWTRDWPRPSSKGWLRPWARTAGPWSR